MKTEYKRKAARLLSLAVIIAGVAVMVGWIFDIGVLKSISPAWISMKFSTAFVFVLSGITIYFIGKAQEGAFELAQVALSITTLTIVLLMGTIFFSTLLGVHTGVEDLFIREMPGGIKTVVPGRPSIPTMIDFMLIAVAGIMTILNPEKLQSKLKVLGLIIVTIGAVAVAGYSINDPLLYYFVEGVNSAIALNTAVLFVLLGMGLVCLSE
jgi:hypothetical protein